MKSADESKEFLFKKSEKISDSAVKVQGPDIGKTSLSDIVSQYYYSIGFQATQMGQAVDIIREMRKAEGCKIYLGYTSNLVSSGLREIFVFLARNRLVDAIVTTAGGIEEDFIKCLAPTYVLESCRLGDVSGAALRQKGLNRIGNLVVPNDNYCLFEDWMMPQLDAMVFEQNTQGTKWSPQKIISRLGKEINNPESIYYWCHRNDIPVYCPALTDGSIGDMVYFHTYKAESPDKQLVVDLVQDIRQLNAGVVKAKKTASIILGGGVVKHHINNANLMRNGADFAVYVNTGQEFDGSDSGASPDEAVSWGKIKSGARSVKICADATLVFPILAKLAFTE